MNKIVLIGRLTKDPELRYTQNGAAVASFTLAVNRNFAGPDGKKDADFINIVVWNKSGEACAQYLEKGSQAAVDGRLQIRTYDGNDGQKRWVTEVVAEHVEFLDSKKENKKDKGQGKGIAPGLGEEIVFSDGDVPF